MILDLRRRIMRGELKPGERLPSHQALVERYEASLVTVQRAMHRLIEEGLVRSEARRGRFVAEHPPSLHRFALALPGHPEPVHSPQWTRSLAAALVASRQLNDPRTCEWRPYFDVYRRTDDNDGAGYAELERDAREHRLAGIFFPLPHELWDAPLLREPTIPTVVGTNPPAGCYPVVRYDRERFVRRAVDHLVQLGRRRLAWVSLSKQSIEYVMTEVRSAGRAGAVTIPPEWIVPADPFHPDWLAHALGVMLDRPTAQRPEGLVVADDHLVEPVVAALADLGVAVPDDLAVVGHWNWPLRYGGSLPVHLIGFDARAQLEAAARLIRTGETVTHWLAPLTQAEFEQRGGVTVPLTASEGASLISSHGS
ncbi:MAG: GntR family transcriptional regulator [bacterium]